MTLTTYVCKECGEEFDAHSSARTAQLGYCSRACMSDGDA
jgi:DNA-directed RNA polymerase subunit RPC12/RpoP